MSNFEENAQTAAAPVVTEGFTRRDGITNVVQNYIPQPWLAPSLAGEVFKYAAVVKQVFIMLSGATVKMRRTMDASQRNLDALLQ